MSNSDIIIEERSRDIGDFLVGRLIPFRKKRMVGPFIFIDHMGPSELGPEKYLDVDQHPHIGLSTLTYLLEGEIEHEDSIGTRQLIKPGSVNWMVAGKGVTHTERAPKFLRNGSPHQIHGYQICVALPKELEECEPEFHHVSSEDLPQWKSGNTSFKVVAGRAFGKESPLPVHSEMFMVEIQTQEAYELNIKGELSGEIGICVVNGSVQACEHKVTAGNLLVSKSEDACMLTLNENTHIFLFGGEAFPERRYIEWNWVSSKKETIEKAKANWKNKDFPMVDGDDSYIPCPT